MWAPILGFVCLVGLLFVLYRPALDGPFYFDSHTHIVSKSNLHMDRITWTALDRAIRIDDGERIYRPLSYLSLAFTYYLAGLDPAAYRIGNVVIHGCAAAALWSLLLSVLGTPRVERTCGLTPAQQAVAAALGVALWALHPIQTNVAAYVIQRMASLAGLFTFLSVGAYLRGRSRPGGWSTGWALASAVTFLLALLSKQNALTILPALVVAEWLLLDPPHSDLARSRLRLLVGVAALGLLAGAVAYAPAIWHRLARVAEVRDYTIAERLLTEARLQISYLTVLLVPDPRLLTLDAEVPISRGLFRPPATAAAILGLLASLCLALMARRRRPLLAFGILWFLLHQAVEGTIVPLELYYEHRMYVPSVFLFLGAGLVGASLARRTAALRALVLLLGVSALAGEAVASYSRNTLWGDPVGFWTDTVKKAPGKPRPRVNLGLALIAEGRYEEAEDLLWEALARGADATKVHLNLATLAFRQGRRDAAMAHLEEAIQADGSAAWLARRGLAELAFGNGDMERAAREASLVLETRPRDSGALNIRGATLLAAGRIGEARPYLEQAVTWDPSHHKAWNNLGAAWYRTQDPRRALRCFRRAAALEPDNENYRRNLREAERALAALENPAEGR